MPILFNGVNGGGGEGGEGASPLLKSGYLGGSFPTITKVSDTEISIGGGTFNFKDQTVPAASVNIEKLLVAIPALTVSIPTVGKTTYIYLDTSDMSIQQNDSLPAGKLNSWVYLGNVDLELGIIAGVFTFTETAFSSVDTNNVLMFNKGDYNLFGCEYYSTGGLSLGHTAGLGVRIGANTINNVADPDKVPTALNSILAVFRAYVDASQMLVSTSHPTDLDPTMYSNEGVLSAVGLNKWTVQYLFHFYGSDVTFIYYGTTRYNDATLALAGSKTPFSFFKVTKEAQLRSAIIVRGGATDLTLSTDAIFINL